MVQRPFSPSHPFFSLPTSLLHRLSSIHDESLSLSFLSPSSSSSFFAFLPSHFSCINSGSLTDTIAVDRIYLISFRLSISLSFSLLLSLFFVAFSVLLASISLFPRDRRKILLSDRCKPRVLSEI